MIQMAAEILDLKRTDGWFAGTAQFSHGPRFCFFVTPSGRQVRFYSEGNGPGGVGGKSAAPYRRAVLVKLGFPASQAGDPDPKPKPVKVRDPSEIYAMRRMTAEIADEYGLTPDDLMKGRCVGRTGLAKHHAMWTIRQQRKEDGSPRYSWLQIANHFRLMDHTSAIHGVKRHQARLDAEPMAEAA